MTLAAIFAGFLAPQNAFNPAALNLMDGYTKPLEQGLGSQATFCAGGRYDGLIEQLGGKSAPACGYAMGMERVMLLWQEGMDDARRMSKDDLRRYVARFDNDNSFLIGVFTKAMPLSGWLSA